MQAYKSTDLAPDKRLAVERLLGRSLAPDEEVQIVARKVDPDSQQALQLKEGKPDQRPIWEVLLETMKDLPSEEFSKLPNDGASEHDHYLYGHPKRHQ